METRCETSMVVCLRPQPAELGEDVLFGARVDAGEAIVEHQQRRVADQPAGEGGALLLATGQGHAPFAHQGVELLREIFDGVAQIRRGGRLPR